MQDDTNWPAKRPPYVAYALGALAVVALLLLVTQWKTINDWTREKPTPGAREKLERARGPLLRDCFACYAEADELIQSAMVESPKAAETNAAFASLQFRWIEALIDKADGGPVQPMATELKRRGDATAEVARVQAEDLPVVRLALAAEALAASPADPERATAVLDFPGADADPDAHYLRARIAMLDGMHDAEAMAELRRTLELEPRYLRAHYVLAQLALRQPSADAAAARRELDTVLRDEPSHDLAKSLLVRLGEPEGE